MERPQFVRSRVDIHEREDGDGNTYWVVDPPGGLHDTATEALDWVQRSNRRVAEGGQNSIAVITWHPMSRTGRMIVRSLTTPEPR